MPPSGAVLDKRIIRHFPFAEAQAPIVPVSIHLIQAKATSHAVARDQRAGLPTRQVADLAVLAIGTTIYRDLRAAPTLACQSSVIRPATASATLHQRRRYAELLDAAQDRGELKAGGHPGSRGSLHSIEWWA
jgi:hypothetical protein